VDDVTYARYNVSTQPPPFNHYVSYIFALEHPLSTDTSSITITSKESELLGHLNGYRNMVMGNNVNPNNPFPNGPSPVLPSFQKGTKCARAHCKHYAYFHPGPMPGEGTWNNHTPLPWTLAGLVTATSPPVNAEGDHVIFTLKNSKSDQTSNPVIFTLKNSKSDQTSNPGMVTPLHIGVQPYNRWANHGRLGKIGVQASPVVGEFSYSGAQFEDSLTVRDQIIIDDGALVVDFWPPPLYPVWTHICAGYWKGGGNSNYWNILFLKNPDPAN
jgi:hypothetical protein